MMRSRAVMTEELDVPGVAGQGELVRTQLRREKTAAPFGTGVSTGNPGRILSGSPRWAETLLVGIGSNSKQNANADFHVYGRQVGYDRRWTAGRGQFAAIDCTAQPGFCVDVTRISHEQTWCVVVAYNRPADERWWREVSFYGAVTAGNQVIPSGATHVRVLTALPTWSWSARNPETGAIIPFPQPLAAGEDYELPTDEFDPGAAGQLLWRIRL